MMVELKVPTEFQLTVDGDLNRRKGIIVGNDQDGDDSVINALELHKMVSSFAYQSNGSYTAIWAPKTTQKSGQILELMAGNRGASGIDGLFSTAVGFAAGHNKRVVCVLGDVSFVHDTNGLALLKQRISRKQMTIIVINNHGGAIFSLLPIANTDDEKTLNQYFYTSHNVGIHNLCSAHGALPKIIKTGFSAINLIYFFTAGADEVKCWKIRRLSKAPQAAGAIHTDFERGFICAEDLKEHGRESTVKVLLIWFGLAKKCSVTEEDCGQGEY